MKGVGTPGTTSTLYWVGKLQGCMLRIESQGVIHAEGC